MNAFNSPPLEPPLIETKPRPNNSYMALRTPYLARLPMYIPPGGGELPASGRGHGLPQLPLTHFLAAFWGWLLDGFPRKAKAQTGTGIFLQVRVDILGWTYLGGHP